ncbi:hypothetical protein QP363_03320 [Corynebacterium sp. UMB6689]|uniref:hypothetical protein n=1 Tax=Corynebacterium sp. UMB6689 TaxID=3046341 RepID=UPI00254AACFD|nr:hypothetical protein [Corynebacterium sp. UMB6689]MDK6813031.1 hypothetical protein [Corynebacterium sp. UMB6689]
MEQEFITATDITGHLRVLFSRLAEPRAGGPATYSFNVPSAFGQGAIEVNGAKEVRRFERTGGMCPRCEGRGEVGGTSTSASSSMSPCPSTTAPSCTPA